MDRQSGRIEKRSPLNVPIWLTSLTNPGPFERAMTENISPAGARIVAPTRWPASEKIVMLCAPGCIANAEIIYSHALPYDANQFALGVRLQNSPAGWPVKAPDAAPFGT
jgi:hypothetical protein